MKGTHALRKALASVLLLAGAVLCAQALYIPAKAALAQVLMQRAWAKALAGEASPKPWPWADISPVAEIEFPRLHRREIVLEGASGTAMAFGPGHMENTAAIGARGTAVVAAHRDTEFRFLKDVQIGDVVAATTGDGRRTEFRVASTRVVKADVSGIDPDDGGPSGARLALATCYPFTGILHSPWRYVVIAEKVGSTL